MTYDEANKLVVSNFSQTATFSLLGAEKMNFLVRGLVVAPVNWRDLKLDNLFDEVLQGVDNKVALTKLEVIQQPLDVFVVGKMKGSDIVITLAGYFNSIDNAS